MQNASRTEMRGRYTSGNWTSPLLRSEMSPDASVFTQVVISGWKSATVRKSTVRPSAGQVRTAQARPPIEYIADSVRSLSLRRVGRQRNRATCRSLQFRPATMQFSSRDLVFLLAIESFTWPKLQVTPFGQSVRTCWITKYPVGVTSICPQGPFPSMMSLPSSFTSSTIVGPHPDNRRATSLSRRIPICLVKSESTVGPSSQASTSLLRKSWYAY